MPRTRRRRPATPPVVAAGRALVAAAGVVIVTGTLVTGSGPHAGDERADRLDLAVPDVVRVHGIAMVLFLAVTVVVVRLAAPGDAAGRGRAASRAAGRAGGAGGLGYWQYFTGVPALLVGFHVLGAALVWIAVLRGGL